jgi:hypothetical protein
MRTTASFSSLTVTSYSAPVFVDIDGDGDYDIVSGALDGKIYCFINSGSSFSQNTTLFAGIDAGWQSAPALADLDGDGDLDMIIGAEDADSLRFYKNVSGAFITDNSFIDGVTSPSYGHPTFADVDNDGDYDLIIGGISGNLRFYENVGSKSLPFWGRFDEVFANVSVRQNAAPGFADLDGDGKVDIVLGEYNGNFSLFKNMMPTEVRRTSGVSPGEFALLQNYPNPFNPVTVISYQLATNSFVTVKVYDFLGREVATLVNGELNEGTYTLQWNATGFASGVYFYRLQARNYSATKKLLLLR